MQLEIKMYFLNILIYFSQNYMSVHYDGESLLATAKIRFVPLPEDNGKYLACRTVNEYFPSEPKEDGYIVNVNCELFYPILHFLL